MPIDRALLVTAQAAIGQALAQLDASTPVETVVRTGDNLQAALDKGGALTLDGIFPGTFSPRSKSVITCRPGTQIKGAGAPGLDILPGTVSVAMGGDLTVTSTGGSVVRIGNNDGTQITADQAPTDITLHGVVIPQHRGKRAFENHGAAVSFIDCEAPDCYDPNGQDSQAMYVGNAVGPWLIDGGTWCAGSEGFLSGGDTMRIPGVTPKGGELRNFILQRPLSWQTDGIPRKVKNLFELKNATDVWVHHGALDGCWANGQQGEAFMLTPALDGAKLSPPAQSGTVRNVRVEDVTVRNCSTLVNLMGRHYTSYTPEAVSGIVFRRVTAVLSKAKFGGRGQIATITAEPNDLTFEDCTLIQDGTSALYYDPATVLDPDTKLTRVGGKLGSLTLTNCRVTAPTYGFMFGGVANAVNWPASVGTLSVTDCTFGGSIAMAKQLPANTFLTRAAFDALVTP